MDKEVLKVVAYPMDIAWADVDTNLKFVENFIKRLPDDIDVLVLPELFSTGFIQDEVLLSEMALVSSRRTQEALVQWARKYCIAIAGSFLCTENARYYNRGFFLQPNGEFTFYDKRHLFCLSAESEVFTPGDALPPVVNYQGWNVSLIVCYDLRFPTWCRNVNQRYDVLLVPANWASARGYAFRSLLVARAIENQSYVVGCNRGGHDDYGDYDNESYIFNPFGYEIAPIDTSSTKGIYPEAIVRDTVNNALYATFTKSQLNKTRSYLPVGRDADAFILGSIR